MTERLVGAELGLDGGRLLLLPLLLLLLDRPAEVLLRSLLAVELDRLSVNGWRRRVEGVLLSLLTLWLRLLALRLRLRRRRRMRGRVIGESRISVMVVHGV